MPEGAMRDGRARAMARPVHTIGLAGALERAAACHKLLSTGVTPTTGSVPPVEPIDRWLVMKVIEPIWTVEPESAGRMRGTIVAIVHNARGHHLGGDNPIR